MKFLRIVFDGSDDVGVVHVGGELRGSVLLSYVEGIQIQKLLVEVRGIAMVQWGSSERNDSNQYYRGMDNYFNKTFDLLENEDGSTLFDGREDTVVGVKFQVRIPENCPSSFEGVAEYTDYGYIRYTCEAVCYYYTMIDEEGICEKQKSRNFTVIRDLDLNREPDASRLWNAMEKDGSADMTCCCRTGSVSATFSLNKQAYVPGEDIIITAEIDNSQSPTDLDCHVAIKQFATYKAYNQEGRSSLKYRTAAIAMLSLGNVCAESLETFTANMAIPSVPPSRLDACDIIDLKYIIRLYARSWDTLKLDHDILIGTIPLRDEPCGPVVHQPTASPPVAGMPSSAPSATPFIEDSDVHLDAPPPYESVAPPSYEQCVYQRNPRPSTQEGIDHADNSTVPWLPHYPNYSAEFQPASSTIGALNIEED